MFLACTTSTSNPFPVCEAKFLHIISASGISYITFIITNEECVQAAQVIDM